MKRLRNHYIGIDSGDLVLFSDFDTGGPMWSGNGPREVRKVVMFQESYRSAPIVNVSMSMWDMSASENARGDLSTENVTDTGFEIVFKTWGDTRVARLRVSWNAMGELRHADEWDLY